MTKDAWQHIDNANGPITPESVQDNPTGWQWGDGWQPIETAPKEMGENDTEGPWVLVYSPECGVHRAAWSFLGRWEMETTAEYDNDYAEIRNPTHWMPLPSPPTGPCKA